MDNPKEKLIHIYSYVFLFCFACQTGLDSTGIPLDSNGINSILGRA